MKLIIQYKILSILFLALLLSSCKNQENSTRTKMELFAKIDITERLSKFTKKEQKTISIAPGINIAVADKNRPLFIKSFGYADSKNEIITNEQSNFYIAYCTKPFNGLHEIILTKEGNINKPDQITNYALFKDFDDKSSFENVTLKDLLSHQNCLINHYLTFSLAYPGQYENIEIVSLVKRETQESETSKTFSYSHLGYYLFDSLLQTKLGIN